METGAKKKESSRGPPPGLENPIPSWMNKNYENPFSKFKPEDLFKPNDARLSQPYNTTRTKTIKSILKKK